MSWRRLGKAAYALTGNKDDAEDLLQSVLERTCARWSKIVHENPHAYVRRALVHGYVDGWRRKRRVRVDPTDDLPDRRCWTTPITASDDRVDLDAAAGRAERPGAGDGGAALLPRLLRARRSRPSSAARSAPSRAPARERSPASGSPLSRSKGTSDERHRRARGVRPARHRHLRPSRPGRALGRRPAATPAYPGDLDRRRSRDRRRRRPARAAGRRRRRHRAVRTTGFAAASAAATTEADPAAIEAAVIGRFPGAQADGTTPGTFTLANGVTLEVRSGPAAQFACDACSHLSVGDQEIWVGHASDFQRADDLVLHRHDDSRDAQRTARRCRSRSRRASSPRRSRRAGRSCLRTRCSPSSPSTSG